jgi:hypothetical protein
MPSSSRSGFPCWTPPHDSITFHAICNAFVFALSLTYILEMRAVLKLVWGGGCDCSVFGMCRILITAQPGSSALLVWCSVGSFVHSSNVTLCVVHATVVYVLSLSAVGGHKVLQSQGMVYNMYRFLTAEGESGPGEKWVQERLPESCGVSLSTVQYFLQESAKMWERKGFWSLLKYDHQRRH